MNAALGVDNIGTKDQTNNSNGHAIKLSIEGGDKSIHHFPSITDGDFIEIKLNLKNSSICSFPNRQKGIVLWDSGATFSLISEGTIKDNAYLTNIDQKTIPNTRFLVGNGSFVLANKSLTFTLMTNATLLRSQPILSRPSEEFP